MATLYIDGTSPTNGVGSFADPYNAVPALGSNNTYLFKGGVNINITANIQTTGLSNINFGTYDPATGDRIYPTQIGTKPKGAPIYDWSAMAQITQTGNVQFTFNISNGNTISLDGLRIKFAGPYVGTPCVVGSTATTCINLTINRCELWHDLTIVDARGQGIQVGNATPTNISNTTITNNYIHDVAVDGIFYAGGTARFNISYNIVERVSMISINGDNIQITASVFNGRVTHNWLDHSDKDVKQVIICSLTTAGSGLDISDNYCIGFSGGSGNSGIYTSHTNSRVFNNIVVNSNIGINAEGTTSQYWGNLLLCTVNCPGGYVGFRIGATGVPQTIFNNTIIKTAGRSANGSTAVDHLNASYTLVFKNNIVWGFDQGLTLSASGYTEDYNCFYNNTTDSNRSLGANSFVGNPNFNVLYQPKLTSNIYRAGEFIAYVTDYDKKQFNNPPSIGAFEYPGDRGTR